MPQAYTTAQKNAIAEFISITQADKTTAAKALKQHLWNTSAAVNTYFASSAAPPSPHRATLSKIFDKYRESPTESPDEIGPEGTGQLFEDVGLALDGVGAFVLSEIVQSPSLGTLTREGFIDGWNELNVDTLPKMRNVVLQRQSQLSRDKELFKSVYNHTFVLALQERQKAVPMEMAMEFWKVLLREPSLEWRTASTPWLDWWMEFYEEEVKKAVNKDLWKQALNFAYETLKDDTLGFWNEESSWPSVIDEFVAWVKARRPSDDAMEIS